MFVFVARPLVASRDELLKHATIGPSPFVAPLLRAHVCVAIGTCCDCVCVCLRRICFSAPHLPLLPSNQLFQPGDSAPFHSFGILHCLSADATRQKHSTSLPSLRPIHTHSRLHRNSTPTFTSASRLLRSYDSQRATSYSLPPHSTSAFDSCDI